uniref:Protein kinase domain-containing protein n=1 Tax=Panagrolaimus sp. PS1159 TaxID=55785 RepID=A0AC35FP08_9BILA
MREMREIRSLLFLQATNPTKKRKGSKNIYEPLKIDAAQELSNDKQVLSYFNEILPISDSIRIKDYEKRYVKVDELGNGRFGTIIKLLDQNTDTFVAGKVVNIELFNHWYQSFPKIKIRVETFLKEYRNIQKLSLSNERIADFVGIVIDSSKIVILYEYAPNGNVKDKISDIPLSEAMALKYFYQTADALEFLHSQRTPVIHMDIKAANILLSVTDNIKLANFGLVRDLTIGGFGMAVASEITEDFRATLLYVAPEVLKSEFGPGDRRAYSEAADIWSLGCTLVEMLTCFPPYFEYYDDCDNFYNDVLSRANGSSEDQLPYDCFSLVPTSSTIIRFIVHKIFDKTPSSRITAEGLLKFLQSLTADNLHHKEKLEGEFQKAYESSQKTIVCGSLQHRRNSQANLHKEQSEQEINTTTAAKKRGLFQSFKGLSIQSLTKLRGNNIDSVKGEPSLSSVSEATIEDGEEKIPVKRKKHLHHRNNNRRKRNQIKECSFCMAYCMSRVLYFLGIFIKSFLSVASFVLVGLTALSIFFLIAFGVIVVVRKIISYFCECDLMAPPILIISGIFLILLFGLLFSCCMVALGEYKYRVANKSLHSSRFFVRRPDKDIRLFGFQLIRGKRLVLKPFKPDFEDDEEEPREILQHVDEDDDRYCQLPTPIPPQDNDEHDLEAAATVAAITSESNNQWPKTIEEEATRKLATTAYSPLGFEDQKFKRQNALGLSS